MCNNLKTVYATGDAARDTYLLNLTNDYLEALDREIRQKSAKEEYLEELYHR